MGHGGRDSCGVSIGWFNAERASAPSVSSSPLPDVEGWQVRGNRATIETSSVMWGETGPERPTSHDVRSGLCSIPMRGSGHVCASVGYPLSQPFRTAQQSDRVCRTLLLTISAIHQRPLVAIRQTPVK